MPDGRRRGDLDDPGTFGWRLAALEGTVEDLVDDMKPSALDRRYLTHEKARNDFVPRDELAAAGSRRARTLNLILAAAVLIESTAFAVLTLVTQ